MWSWGTSAFFVSNSTGYERIFIAIPKIGYLCSLGVRAHFFVPDSLSISMGMSAFFSLWRHQHRVHHFKATTASILTWKAQRAVVQFIINITKGINFSSKVYSKSLLKGSPLSCTPFEEVISSPQYGYRYLSKMKEIYIFSTVWILIRE